MNNKIELRYPIGMQTFSNIIEDGYTYVDKTQYIHKLIKQGKFIFLSRPRRFGKSLMLSTLKAYFEGKRELFKGLAADNMDLDWLPSPVFRFDFNAEDFSKDGGLEQLIDWFLRDYERVYGRKSEDNSLSQRFKNLIISAFEKTGSKVVVLIDEYDKPLLATEKFKELYEKNHIILKSFFGNLKTMDEYIRFAFITGVARFNKVSIFSDLNNLDDISFDNTFADICGWTEEELLNNFRPGIQALAEELDEDFDSSLKSLRDYYDGYKFTPKGSKIYNPFSVLKALKAKEIEPYWFETGTHTFIAERVRESGIDPRDLNGVRAAKDDLVAIGFNMGNPVPLMFQTGYLTIESYDRKSNLCQLRFPNREVEIGFFKHLLPLYVPVATKLGNPFEFTNFKMDIITGAIQDFMKRLASLLKDLPGEDHNESTYRAVTYLIAVLSGTTIIAEHNGYKGRSDIEIATEDFVYLFEFKYNKTVHEAMDQIISRDYIGRFELDPRTVFIIGANFNEKMENRGLEYEIKKLR